MTQDEITTKIDELQTALNQLSQQLIQANSAGIQLLTEQALLKKRLEDNDYQDEN